ncbi:hypothetical protein BD408DRAFT_438559 [Parasitella parasitica]|nr:hypothetical protein BD408DRAFT_438559 [Parasitella parasitica]
MPRNNITINIESSNSLRISTPTHERSEEEPKERQSKRQKVLKEKKLPAEKDAILKSGQSTGTKIEHHAQDLYFGKQYHKPERNGQRNLFTKEEWLKLNSKWNKQKNWDQLDDVVQRMLKKIENLALNDLKKAYVKTLSYQSKYAPLWPPGCSR